MNQKEYLELFQTKALKQFSKAAQALKDMRSGLKELRNYFKSEEQNIIELVDEIALMERKIEPALLDAKGCDDFKAEMQTYKNELARLRTDLTTSRELVATLEKTVPKKSVEVETTGHQLFTALNGFVRTQRHIADAELKDKVLEIEAERDSFLDCFTEIYEALGVSFIRHDASLMPGGLTQMKLAELKKNCGLTMPGG